jgi:hypothetical protein
MILYVLMSVPSFVIMLKSCSRQTPCSESNEIIQVNKTKAQQLFQVQQIANAEFQIQKQRLEKKNDSLEKVIQANSKILISAKQISRIAQDKLFALTRYHENDSCPSTREIINASVLFMQESSNRDSLCDLQTNLLSEAIIIKDSIIENCNSAYNGLQENFEALSSLHTSLSVTAEKIQADLKKQRRKAKIFSSGTIALCGAIITMIIVSH